MGSIILNLQSQLEKRGEERNESVRRERHARKGEKKSSPRRDVTALALPSTQIVVSNRDFSMTRMNFKKTRGLTVSFASRCHNRDFVDTRDSVIRGRRTRYW